MSRDGYTRLIRELERAQLATREKQLVELVRQLRLDTDKLPIAVPRSEGKDRRTARLVQKRIHKPVHEDRTPDTRA